MVEKQQKLEVDTLFLVRWRSSKISEENINKKKYIWEEQIHPTVNLKIKT